jgi:hypothetical protein
MTTAPSSPAPPPPCTTAEEREDIRRQAEFVTSPEISSLPHHRARAAATLRLLAERDALEAEVARLRGERDRRGGALQAIAARGCSIRTLSGDMVEPCWERMRHEWCNGCIARRALAALDATTTNLNK